MYTHIKLTCTFANVRGKRCVFIFSVMNVVNLMGFYGSVKNGWMKFK